MDDSKQVKMQNTNLKTDDSQQVGIVDDSQAQQSDNSYQAQPLIPPPVPPVGLPHKEAEPIPSKPSVELMTPTEHKIELSEELKEAGVEHAKEIERAELSPEAKEAGVEHAKESVGMDPVAIPMVQLPPYKREEVLPHTKSGSVTDAAKWFYVFLLRQIDKVKKQNLTQK